MPFIAPVNTASIGAAGTWRPIHWEPVVHSGADFVWAATMARGHDIVAAELWIGGTVHPVAVGSSTITATVPASRLGDVRTGDPAELFIELSTGVRLCWLDGRIVVGERGAA